MRRDRLGLQGWAVGPGGVCVLADEQCDGVAAERCPATGGEQRVGGLTVAFIDPHLDHCDCVSGERRALRFSAFAQAADVSAVAEMEVLAAKPGELRHAHAGLDGEGE